MRRILSIVLALIVAMPSVFAGKPVILITPGGIFRSEVVNGVPGPWAAYDVDVIIQDLSPGGTPTPVPPVADPPVSDPVVAQISAISKAGLKDAKEATAVASIVDSLSKFGLTGSKLKESLELAGPIADSSLKAEGRIIKWITDATRITTDAAKLKAGVKAAWNIEAATLDTIHAAATSPEAELSEAAIDWMEIIKIIQIIIELLKNLGVLDR